MTSNISNIANFLSYGGKNLLIKLSNHYVKIFCSINRKAIYIEAFYYKTEVISYHKGNIERCESCLS